MKISSFIATSLDGFISRENGNIEWLESYHTEDEDYGYQEYISSIDCIVMGRNTFEKVMEFSFWPYGDLKVYVLCTTLKTVPNTLIDKVEVINLKLDELISKLEQNGFQNIYVDGGKTIQSFLKAGRLNEITISIIPILIGQGKRLFQDIDKDVFPNLIKSMNYKNGIVQLIYKIK